MNKIILENDQIKNKEIDNSLNFSYDSNNTILNINTITINVLKDTTLEIVNNQNNSKINVLINVNDGVNFSIFEYYNEGSLKIQNVYEIGSNSHIYINKIYDVEKIKQNDIINLNGECAKVDYILKSISKNVEKYNLLINHNASKTVSNIVNNAVNIENGHITFDVIGVVPKGNIDCTLNQNNRIVTFNDKKCQINPILLIDENDVSANHSAFVGKFSDEELFYLQSRGITHDEAIKLLIKGFLFSNLNVEEEKIEKIINKYWR